MTKRELIEALESFDDDEVVVGGFEDEGWDNIQYVERMGSIAKIVFGGGSPFSDE